MKTVAAISFLDNHSLTMDVENVSRIEITAPTQLDDKMWCCELLVRTPHGIVALNMVSDDPAKLQAIQQGLE
jgi:hypothetical protein